MVSFHSVSFLGERSSVRGERNWSRVVDGSGEYFGGDRTEFNVPDAVINATLKLPYTRTSRER